jgi:hypothetical protein
MKSMKRVVLAALQNAIGGNAGDAILALDRYLDQHRGDEASLFLALSWLFEASAPA